MTKEEQEFLEKHFKASEYSMVTIMVRNEDLTKMVDALKAAKLNVAILPGVDASMKFADPNVKGTPQ
jgi:hypothetical protein